MRIIAGIFKLKIMTQKNINIIYGVVLAALLYKQYKRCVCCAKKKKEALSQTEDGEMSCEDAVDEVMKAMKFGSNEEMNRFKDAEIKKCKETR